MTDGHIAEVFCQVDDFVEVLKKELGPRLLPGSKKRQRLRETGLCESEMMTILILFHRSGYRAFKHFYTQHVQRHWCHLFPGMVSYTRFISLLPRVVLPMCGFLQTRYGRNTGIAFVDSTRLPVCHNKRISRNRVFDGIAKIGKSTMGWFYGFKLHIVINELGELLAVRLTQGNVDDRKPVDEMTHGLVGKLFGDKGYISGELFDALYERGLTLITQIRRNMKNRLMPWIDKILLRKRSIIETVNDQLKNISQVEHTRHRAAASFLINVCAGLIAYTYQPKKPRLKMPATVLGMGLNTALVL